MFLKYGWYRVFQLTSKIHLTDLIVVKPDCRMTSPEAGPINRSPKVVAPQARLLRKAPNEAESRFIALVFS